jgi:hypothetical protein
LLHSFKKAQSQLNQQGHFCVSRGTLPLQLRRATYLFAILLRTMSEKLIDRSKLLSCPLQKDAFIAILAKGDCHIGDRRFVTGD